MRQSLRPGSAPGSIERRGPRAWWLAAAACGAIACGPPTVRPGAAPPEAPTGPSRDGSPAGKGGAAVRPPSANPGRQWLVGEMCPQAGGGRPAVAPLFLRGVGWSANPDAVSAPLARGAVSQFSVLGVEGKRAGSFSVVGTSDIGLARDVAVGSYAGASPCALTARDGKATDDPACTRATNGCGLAIAVIEPGHDAFSDAPVVPLRTGGACIAGNVLAVDIDGDGAVETYPVSQLFDAMRAPAEEVTAAPASAPACTPHFAQLGVRLTPGVDGGTSDPRYVVDLDVLGVVDVDGDGRREIFLAYRYAEGRTIAVYSASGTVARLELAGETVPWQR